MQRYRLRYVDGADLGDSVMQFDMIDVDSAEGKKLGTVNGYLIDHSTGRPFYVVVDAGGWFKSKYFLVPIGHARFDTERHALVTDLTHEHVERFPGFDLDEFDTLSDDEVSRLDEQVLAACCPGEQLDRASSVSRYDQWAHYREPDWWTSTIGPKTPR